MIANTKRMRLVGVGIVAVGAILLLLAWWSWRAPVEPVAEAMFSNHDGPTMLYLMLGIVMLIGGAVLSKPQRRRSS
jgi:polyferredoxin